MRTSLSLAAALLVGPALLHAQTPRSEPTVAGAHAFMARAESTLNDLTVRASRADWIANTYITYIGLSRRR